MFIIFLLCILIFSFIYIIFDFFFNFKPVIHNSNFTSHFKGNIRNRYTFKKATDQNYDIIIIGSGISSLTVGAILAKTWKKVLVIEQHYVAGGCTHTFKLKGYEFDTGLHYVGNVNKLSNILDKISYYKINWDKLGTEDNGYTYDEICFRNNSSYKFKSGINNFIDEMSKFFPHERFNMLDYLYSLRSISNQTVYFITKILKNRTIAYILNKTINNNLFKHTKISAENHIKGYIKNHKLQKILLGQYGDYGRLPSEENVFIHAGVFDHYISGAYYPNGGSCTLATGLTATIENNLGKVLVGKKVDEIIIENNKAIGIRMVNGDELYANKIISGIGIKNTYENLLKSNQILYRNINISDLKPSKSVLSLFIGLNQKASNLDLINHNLWYIPEETYVSTDHSDIFSREMTMFITFPCLKDKSFYSQATNYNKSTCIILCLMDYKHFEKWNNCKNYEYKLFKEHLIEKILEEGLYRQFPKTRGYVDFIKLGTPLTYNNFINSQNGEIYGMETDDIRFQANDWLLPRSDISNLYLTGQDICTPGIAGAIMSGVITSHAVCGYGDITDLIFDRNLFN